MGGLPVPRRGASADPAVDRDGFAARALGPAESAIARAALHAAMDRPVDARASLDQARKADPTLAALHDVEGLLFEREGKSDEARPAYDRAEQAGTWG